MPKVGKWQRYKCTYFNCGFICCNREAHLEKHHDFNGRALRDQFTDEKQTEIVLAKYFEPVSDDTQLSCKRFDYINRKWANL